MSADNWLGQQVERHANKMGVSVAEFTRLALREYVIRLNTKEREDATNDAKLQTKARRATA